MSDNKRFIVKYIMFDGYCIYDTVTDKYYDYGKNDLELLCNVLNNLSDGNLKLKKALKNSYINEICENCKFGEYFLSSNFDWGFEGDFRCHKGHSEFDGLKDCIDFELDLDRWNDE